MGFVSRLLEESPFRLFVRKMVEHLPFSIVVKSHWDAAERPHYLVGILAAAQLAKEIGLPAISCVEFGVAGGAGLLIMEKYASRVSSELGIQIRVFGFDSGRGMPDPVDYRDHPEAWIAGDYPMDEPLLRSRLSSRTTLILGSVADTLQDFILSKAPPIGFISFDLDYYSSTIEAFHIFGAPHLPRVFLYFDDVCLPWCHRYAGERLAIEDFNSQSSTAKIDKWYELSTTHRPFIDASWLQQMYVSHDLNVKTNRQKAQIHTVDGSII